MDQGINPFAGITKDDADIDKIYFDPGEVIEFAGMDVRVDPKKGHIFIKGRVLTGPHVGKEYTIPYFGGESDASKKHRAALLYRSGFWTQAEIDANQINMQKIVGAKYQGKAGKIREVDGEKYQNVQNLKFVGAVDEVVDPNAQQAPAQQAAQAPANEPTQVPQQLQSIAGQVSY